MAASKFIVRLFKDGTYDWIEERLASNVVMVHADLSDIGLEWPPQKTCSCEGGPGNHEETCLYYRTM